MPLLLAEACVASGRSYVLVGLKGFANDSDLGPHPHVWTSLGRVGELYNHLKDHKCTDVVMAGRVVRPDFKKLNLDAKGVKLLPKVLKSALQGDDSLFRVLVESIEADGFNVIGADEILRSLLAPKGPLTSLSPSDEDTRDIDRAREVIAAMGALDIGQACVVCRSLVLAVEAAEGTDKMLDRCIGLPAELRGSPGDRKGVLVKIPKPGQERRVDLPTIGPDTVRKASRAGLAGIAIAEGGSLILDKEKVVEFANSERMFVFGI